MSNRIYDEYVEWLINSVCEGRYYKPRYNKLLMRLQNTEFRYSIPRDQNRAEQGEDLRYRFALSKGYDIPTTVSDLGNPCSLLEMMIALAIQCEENLMDDPRYGDRRQQWFWNMVATLGLGPMTDEMYDEQYVTMVIERFLNREYEPDGKGGLFRIRDCEYDLRDVELWYQMCWYMNTIE